MGVTVMGVHMALGRSENFQKRDSTWWSFDIRKGWARMFALLLVFAAEWLAIAERYSLGATLGSKQTL